MNLNKWINTYNNIYQSPKTVLIYVNIEILKNSTLMHLGETLPKGFPWKCCLNSPRFAIV